MIIHSKVLEELANVSDPLSFSDIELFLMGLLRPAIGSSDFVLFKRFIRLLRFPLGETPSVQDLRFLLALFAILVESSAGVESIVHALVGKGMLEVSQIRAFLDIVSRCYVSVEGDWMDGGNGDDQDDEMNRVENGDIVNTVDHDDVANAVNHGDAMNMAENENAVNSTNNGDITDNGNTTNPTDNGNTVNPTDNGNTTNPTDNGNTVNPTDNGNTVNPTDNGNTVNLTDNGNTVNPTDNGNTANTTDNGNTTNPTDNGNTTNPTNNNNATKQANNTTNPINTLIISLFPPSSEMEGNAATLLVIAKTIRKCGNCINPAQFCQQFLSFLQLPNSPLFSSQANSVNHWSNLIPHDETPVFQLTSNGRNSSDF